MPRNPVIVRQSSDSQPGTDARGLGMCTKDSSAMTSADQRASILPEVVGRAFEPHFRTDPCPVKKEKLVINGLAMERKQMA